MQEICRTVLFPGNKLPGCLSVVPMGQKIGQSGSPAINCRAVFHLSWGTKNEKCC